MDRIARYKGHYYIGNSTVNNTVGLRTPKSLKGFEFVKYGSLEYFSKDVPADDIEWFHGFDFGIIIDGKEETSVILKSNTGTYTLKFLSVWYYENVISCEPIPYDRGGFDVIIDIDRPSSFFIIDRDLLTDHKEKNTVDKEEFIRQYLQVQAWKNGEE